MSLNLLKNGIEIIKKELFNMPNTPGVYRMLDQDEKILYIGKAKDLAKRIINYTQPNRLTERMKLAIAKTFRLEIITVESEAQALILEANLIKSLKPKYNILLKDDKSLPYVLLRQNHAYSQLLKFRGEKKIEGQYFGPFASPKIVDDTIEFLEKTFLLRNCTDSFFEGRKSACMQYQIKRCSAPCVGQISLDDYQKNCEHALAFLQGKNITLQNDLSILMQQASEKLEFEKAAKYRDQLRSLNYIQNKNANLFNLEEADVVGLAKFSNIACVQIFLFRNNQNYGNKSFFFEQVQDESEEKILAFFLTQFYQNNVSPKEIIIPYYPEEYDEIKQIFNFKLVIPKNGSKKQAIDFVQKNAILAIQRKFSEKQNNRDMLKEVQSLFSIKNPIKRIEVYDNSHISGTAAVGAVVVAGEEGFIKKDYRKYNIKDANTADDYAMLREVLERRLVKLKEMPDLLLIDGGEGHLSTAQNVLYSIGLNIPLVCISKGVDRNAGKEIFHQVNKAEFTLSKDLAVMKYLQILRDEVHRYAITSHRKKRSMAMNFSLLTQIPGIGKNRRKVLINHFTSIDEIRNASVLQLIKLEGISKHLAEEIHSFFRKN